MRGEDYGFLVYTPSYAGSPPHARGRPAIVTALAAESGITPACAGKTDRIESNIPDMKDHPRMRGEDSPDESTAQYRTGSPPHARGRPAFAGYFVALEGITPACAGKTRLIEITKELESDHPRMRGEDVDPITVGFMQWGSPPHARGRRRSHNRRVHAVGITPACAGKTPTHAREWCRAEDHPRMRGEDFT